ncbi:MAG: M15 family metallopeptidase [Gammaproteobacteria bacterium]|nr:M15 family metallopeptidase [Gammaproteobacteria bacterium]
MLDYKNRIMEIHVQLGISDNYASQHGLVLQWEETHLVDIGEDIFQRPQQLSEQASARWQVMKSQAKKDGVLLGVVSAFRSVDAQTKIIQKKLDQGQALTKILKINAAPGYSEHHTGCALDITTPGCAALSESFESTEAFDWLRENAREYSFLLSYPRKNSFGIAYEPWHWAYHEC